MARTFLNSHKAPGPKRPPPNTFFTFKEQSRQHTQPDTSKGWTLGAPRPHIRYEVYNKSGSYLGVTYEADGFWQYHYMGTESDTRPTGHAFNRQLAARALAACRLRMKREIRLAAK